MNVTVRALKRLLDIRRRRGLSATTSLRLGVKDRGVYLKWEEGRPRGDDFIIRKRGLPVLIDAEAYMVLGGLVLDIGLVRGISQFVVRRSIGRERRAGS